MLCEISATSNFVVTWLVLTILGVVAQFVLSGIPFWLLYVRPSYATWRWKTNGKYPSAWHVRNEIVEMLRSLWAATMCPALALWMSQHGMGQAYCGVSPASGLTVGYLAVTTVAVVVISDYYEFLYHWCGHRFSAMWSVHKSHHIYANPSPFAVIADEAPDQFMRSLPLLVFPLVIPINMDMMFIMYSVIFYGYGTYLHTGFELPFLSAHNPLINTSYHHHLHHALSIKNKPYHTGFAIKLWDNIFGSVYPKACFCVVCQHAAGKRTRAEYDAVVKPSYAPLLSPSFWLHGPPDAGLPAKAE